MKNVCPVCGYPALSEPAYYQNDPSASGSFEICPSCGYQFGFTDQDRHITHEQWRTKWIGGGMVWDKGRSEPPPGWDPREQLLNVGVKIPPG